MTLANAFKAFTELITGKKSAGTQIAGTGKAAEQSLGNAAGAADNLSKATTGAGKAAQKAAKEMKALMGFDQINKLDVKSDNGSGDLGGSGGGGDSSGISGEMVDFGNLEQGETAVDKMDQSLNRLLGRVKELAQLFKKGFCISFGDSDKNIKKILSSIENIKNDLVDIFTAKKVMDAAGKWADVVALNTGKVIGAVANVGISIVTNFTAGIAKSLDEKKDFIKEKIAGLFMIGADSWNITGDFVSGLGDIISSSLTSGAAINITADICSMLTTGVLGGAELFAQAGLDLTSFLLRPIIDNKDKISEAITNTLGPISTNIGVLKQAVEDLFSAIKTAYDEHVAPTLSTLKQGFSDSLGKLLDAYNEYAAPVLQNLADKFKEVYEQHLKPCFDKLGELIGKVAGAVEELYLTWLKPFIDWCIETLVPILAPIFEFLGDIILTVFGKIGDIVGGLIDIFSGVIDFLAGLFTGNWDQVWCGLEQILGVFADVLIIIWRGIIDFFGGVLEKIKQIFSPIGDWFSSKFQSASEGIKNVFSGIRDFFGGVWNGICDVFSPVVNWFRDTFSSAWQAVKDIFSTGGQIFSGITDGIGNFFRTTVNAIIGGLNKVIAFPFNKINGMLNKIRKISFLGISPFSGLWSPNPLPVPQIPKLAQGGFVKANTPQLAMIGDNRHQGEVVAPEDKLLEMAQKAAQMSGGENEYSLAILSVLKEILSVLKELDLNIVIDGKKLKDIIVEKINQHTKTTGVCEIVV